MNFKIIQKKLTGAPSSEGWVVSSDFLPINENLANTKGHLFALISMVAQKGYAIPQNENTIVAKEILTRLQEEYFNKNANQFVLLETAVKNIHQTFSSPNQSLHILVAIILGNKIILSGIGQVQALLKRNNELAQIIKPNDQISSASGLLQKEDEIFLATSSFLDKITPQVLKSKEDFSSLPDLQSNDGLFFLKTKLDEIPLPPIENIQKVVQKEKPLPMPKRISPVRLALARLIDQILRFLPKDEFVKEEFKNPSQISKKKKITTLVGFILLLLLIVSILFGARQKQQKDSKSQYEPILTSVQHQLKEAENLSAINSSRSRDLIISAKNQIADLQAKKIKDPRIAALAEQITNDLGKIAGIYLDEPSKYLDLTLLNNDFKGDDIASSEERMVVLDRKGKRLETIDLPTGRADPVAGPDVMPNAVDVAAYSDRNFVSADNGIWEIGDKAGVIIPKDWGSDILISAYAGNLYILDRVNSKVWRYQANGGVFNPKQNWFGSGVNPNLSDVLNWTIDGSIWMLTKDGRILRFSDGSPIDFNITEKDKDLQAIDLFTTQESKYLYLLDAQHSRIVVIDKNGSYKAEYLSDNIKNATKIVVSEPDKKIILLEGPKLFALEIKHL